MKKKIQMVLGFTLSAGFIGWAFWQMKLDDVRVYLQSVRWGWAMVFVVATLATFWWRAWRWQLILAPQRKIPVSRLFGPMMVGFAFNNVFPLRAGEFARPYALAKAEGVPFATGLSSVVLERVLDMCTLLTLIALAPHFVTLDPSISLTWNGHVLGANSLNQAMAGGAKLVILMLVCVACALIDPVREGAVNLVLKLPLGAKIKSAVRDLANNAKEGLSAARSPVLLGLMVFHSAAIWLGSGATYLIISHAFPVMPQLNFVQAMAFIVVTCAVISVPAAPGFWGIFEIGGFLALRFSGVVDGSAEGKSMAIAFTMLLHLLQWIPLTVIGLWYAARLQVKVSEARTAVEPVT